MKIKKLPYGEFRATCDSGKLKILIFTITIGVLMTLAFGVSAEELPATPTFDKPISEMTISELQAKIAEILQAIQQLQTLLPQLNGQEISGIPADFTFKKSLSMGMSDPDVVYLKIILDAEVDHEPWKKTEYFGSGTEAAVIAFQTKYKNEISLITGYSISCNGYVGPGTRTQLNTLLTAVGEKEEEEEEEEEEKEDITLYVDIKASLLSQNWQDPLTGTAPLNNVDLRAIVTGTATGTVDYMFDCENDGIWDSPDTFYFKGVKTTLKDFVNQCNYPDPGTYIAKVKVERGAASPTEDIVTIIVAPVSPPGPQCGDGECNGAETCLTCPNDCGACLPRNNPPTLIPIGNKSIDENQELAFTVSAIDPDDDALYYSIQNRPRGATFSDQIFTWTPSYEQSGTYNVTFIVSDIELTDKETITIIVIER